MGKKDPPVEEGVPLWMCTYGDLMSLLLCFFIMLFALSIIAEQRVQALADTLTQDFTGYAGSSSAKSPKVKTTTTPTDSAAKSRRTSTLAGGQPTPGPVGESTEVHVLILDGETTRVILFELSSDELTDQAKLDLQTIFPRLRGSDHKIMVKGHAAPTEEEMGGRRNVDLAFYRALSVVDHFVSLGLQRTAFEIVGDSTTVPSLNLLPAGTNPAFAGTSVEIVILNQTIRE